MILSRMWARLSLLLIPSVLRTPTSRLFQTGAIRTCHELNSNRLWSSSSSSITLNLTNSKLVQISIKETQSGRKLRRLLLRRPASSAAPFPWPDLPNWTHSETGLSILSLMRRASQLSHQLWSHSFMPQSVWSLSVIRSSFLLLPFLVILNKQVIVRVYSKGF